MAHTEGSAQATFLLLFHPKFGVAFTSFHAVMPAKKEGLKSWGQFASPAFFKRWGNRQHLQSLLKARCQAVGRSRKWLCQLSSSWGPLLSHTRKATGTSQPVLWEQLDCLYCYCLEWIYVVCIQTCVYFVPASPCRQSLSHHLAWRDMPTWMWRSTCFPSWFTVLLLNIAQLS